ncbi:MAG: deoxyribose-phosphate aldolase [Candidatus Woesearchaeota archaeon]
MIDKKELAKLIDYSLLKADATQSDIKKLCLSAIKYGTNSICINPHYVVYARNVLKKSKIRITSVISYPLGADTTDVKIFAIEKALKDGANELDIVMNIGMFKSKRYDYVLKELKKIVSFAKKIKRDAVVKIIIETGMLTKKEIKKASILVLKSGADFVKTGTGWSKGATVEDVKIIKSVVNGKIKIKAAGGIRTAEQAEKLIKAGATRLGISHIEKILS